MRRALVIVNPIAGRGAGQRGLGEIERELRARRFSTEVAVTSRAGDAQRAAAAQGHEHDVVVVVGGDGTLNEVINGLRADTPVALYPLGTGNVLAKELNLPRDAERFCSMVERNRQKALDLAAVGGRRFVSMAGVGFDAAVAGELAAVRRGVIRMAQYITPVLGCLAGYRFPRIAVSIDGREPAEARGFALISNVRHYGGPFVVTPDARPDDGLLDVCLLPRGSRVRYALAMLAFIAGGRRWLGGAAYFRGRSIHVTAEESVPYQVDGDPAGWLPATFELLDRKLRLVVP